MDIRIRTVVLSFAVAWSLLIAAFGCTSDASAQDQPLGDSRQLLLSMLDDDWTFTKAAQQSARKKFDVVKRALPANANVDYLYALVLMKQRQYTSAVDQLDTAIKISPDNTYSWRARLWVTVLQKKYGAALADMETLLEKFPAKEKATPDTPNRPEYKAWSEAAEDMGRLIGFMEGPVRIRVDTDAVADTREAIEKRLPPAMYKDFDKARLEVISKFNDLVSDAKIMQGQDVVAEDDRRKAEADNITRERSELDSQRKEIAPRRDSARDALQSDLDALEREASPLRAQLSRLDVSQVNISSTIAAIESDVSHLYAAAAREKDPARKASLLRRAEILRHSERPYLAQLSSIQSSMRSINSRLSRLAGRRNATQNSYNNEMRELDKASKRIESRLKRLGYSEKKLSDPNTGLTPRVNTTNRKAETLATYIQFPLESEKRRMQGLLKK